MGGQTGPVLVLVLFIIAVWYIGAFALNSPFQRDLDRRANVERSFPEFVAASLQPAETDAARAASGGGRPLPDRDHRQAVEAVEPRLSCAGSRFPRPCSASRSARCSASRSPSQSCMRAPSSGALMPWIIASQTIPILAIAPMVIVVLASIGVKGLLPKAIISTYLSFFPVTVGMVKGLRSPDPILLDLMRTYNASRGAGLLEAARAGLGAVPLRLDEGGDRDQPGRRHRRRAADWRGGRNWLAAADRLLLQPDDPALVGADRGFGPGGVACHVSRHGRPHRATQDGGPP